jgi:hypothetical protein
MIRPGTENRLVFGLGSGLKTKTTKPSKSMPCLDLQHRRRLPVTGVTDFPYPPRFCALIGTIRKPCHRRHTRPNRRDDMGRCKAGPCGFSLGPAHLSWGPFSTDFVTERCKWLTYKGDPLLWRLKVSGFWDWQKHGK